MKDCDISKYPERFCQSAFSINDGSGFLEVGFQNETSPLHFRGRSRLQKIENLSERAPNYNLPGCSNTNSGMSWKMYNETKPGNWYFFSDQCNLFFDIMSVYFYVLTAFIIISNGTLLVQYFCRCGKKAGFMVRIIYRLQVDLISSHSALTFEGHLLYLQSKTKKHASIRLCFALDFPGKRTRCRSHVLDFLQDSRIRVHICIR